MREMKIACLNVNRLLPKLDQIRIFCEAGNLDVLAVNETKLDSQIGDNEIQMNGYDIIRKDRNKFGGGVCLNIKNKFNYTVRNDLMHEQLENIIIEIKKPNLVPIFVCTWYQPPGSPIELFEIFESTIEKVDALKGELYVLGDLNCDLLA